MTTVDNGSPAGGGGLEIIIVDDEAEVSQEIAAGLEEDGHVCVIAATALDAIARITAAPGDCGVLVTDIRMPGMDGVTLARRITDAVGEAARPEFVLVTGHAVPAELSAALPGMIIEVVRKPFRWAEFIGPVERALGRARVRAAARG